jgi:hypothetical protein
MRLASLRFLSALAALLALSACADSPAAPENDEAVAAFPSFKIYPMYAADGRSADFIVTPTGGTFNLGEHAIYFPRNSICDPETSSYGPTRWDEPCRALRKSITIHAELRELNGRSWVDFTPALRFVPSRHKDQWVLLFMQTDAKPSDMGRIPPILWSPAIGVPGIDESLTDATLRTQWDRRKGGVYRRIKHFSGYNVHSGYF